MGGTEGPGLVWKVAERAASQKWRVCSVCGRIEAISGGRNRAARRSFGVVARFKDMAMQMTKIFSRGSAKAGHRGLHRLAVPVAVQGGAMP